MRNPGIELPRSLPDVLTLQYLRGFAAMAVAMFHVQLGLAHYGKSQGIAVSKFGAAGVDLFFVLSGFIMLYITAGKQPQPLVFLKLRLLRVLPLYWLVTLVMFLMPLVSSTIGWSSDLDPRHLLTSLFCIGGVQWSAKLADYPIYRAGWTINFEVFFYLVFAACLCIKPVRNGAIAASMVLIGLVAFGFVGAPQSGIIRFYTAPILLEFVFGIATAAWYLSGRKIPRWLGFPLIIVGLAGLWLLADGSPVGFVRGLPAAIIVIGMLTLEPLARLRPIPLVKLLGDASYSIYLTHLFTLPAMDAVWHKFLPQMSAGWIPVYFVVGAVVSALGGIICFYLLERPLHRWARGGRSQSNSRVTVSAG